MYFVCGIDQWSNTCYRLTTNYLITKFVFRLNFIYFCIPNLSNHCNTKYKMYAIVDIEGQQFKVEKDKKIYVNRLEGDEGSEINLDKVLLIDNDNEISIGNPGIKDAVVKATIIGHLKGDKVLVFKKKRRKGYQKLNGHRQYLTQIEIKDIVL